MSIEVIVFVGLQASGKSSFYRERFAHTHELVSKDCFRNNSNPSRRQRQFIKDALAAGRSVVIDNTNSTTEDRAELITLARDHGANVLSYYFASRLEECLERNRLREGKARVPDAALFATRKRMQLPSFVEGFDQMFYVRMVLGAGFEVLPWMEGLADEG